MDSDAGILTQMDTDTLRWDTDASIIICVPSVLIPVHLWLLAGEGSA